MTESWGALVQSADPAEIPDLADRPGMLFVCSNGHNLIKLYAPADPTQYACVAMWRDRLMWESSDGIPLLGAQEYYGLVPFHIVARDHNGRAVYGALIGGLLTARCRCGNYSTHTRDVERAWAGRQHRRVVVSVRLRSARG